MPIIMKEAGDIPVELHSHCTTGLAPLVYIEALELGVKTLHCGIPPLADGPAQPSVLDMIRNARLMGYSIDLDEKLLQSVSKRLYAIARQANMPLGEPMRYDCAQYIHQIPGGVISNLRFQLAEIGLAHRLDEVIQECIQIREDLGYPIMITPFSQFVGTQAALNIATGERYKIVIDELIRFAQGVFGEDSGYTWMDQNLEGQMAGLAAREGARHARQASDRRHLARRLSSEVRRAGNQRRRPDDARDHGRREGNRGDGGGGSAETLPDERHAARQAAR